MKHSINLRKNKSLLLFAAGALILASCTKQIPYKALTQEVKQEDVPKDLINEKDEFLMSTAMLNASRSSTDALPFSSGDNKRVKLQITKDSLRIIETERDNRFSANTTNDKLVMEIPAEHVQYQCAKDRFGECTNTEEQNTDIPWQQRSTLRLKFEEARMTELNLLPIFISQTLGENCYTKTAGRILKAQIEADAINITYENTFQTNIDCLQELDKTSDATVVANYHISLVKVNSVISKDYKTISYPEGSTDEQTFGFFSSRKTQLDIDNNNTDHSVVQIMNRWNPNRTEIVYHLSDEFAKPENKLIKDLTYQTVDNLNKGLSEAGVHFRINLKDPSGKTPGDIRNSMIVLVEDPVASSIIGYGPQTEDPVTGEIISARTVMFLGTIKKYIKYTYDEIIREKRSAKVEKLKASSITLSDTLKQNVLALKSTGKVFGASDLADQVMSKINSTQKSLEQNNKKISVGLLDQNSVRIVKDLKNYTANKNPEYSGRDLKSQLKYMNEAKNCAFAPAIEGASGGISQKLMAQISDDAKPWENLTDSEKEKVIAIILPEIWVPTLIHEMGHNLGLRHNFAASEDKANYLSQEELQKIGSDHQIPFSSVMDYGNDLKTLPVLGKYDIAALKFGYLRQVEVQSGDQTQMTDVTETLQKLNPQLETVGLKVKQYQYCTDENLGINAGCKQFDLGSSYTEIVQNLIKDYEDGYTKRNLRDGRANMSLADDLTYVSRINRTFKELRIMMEVVERFKYRYGLSDDSALWEKVPFLKDLKQATLIGGSFLTNVLLVPDTMCAFANMKDASVVISVINLNEINPDVISCFKLDQDSLNLVANFLSPDDKDFKVVVVGQGGKMLNSKKDPESNNSFADQIDVRGIWLDKIYALKNLVNRQIGILSMDEHTDSFLNQSDLRQGILNAVKGLMTNNVVNKVTFTLLDGSKEDLEINYDMAASQVAKKPFLIDMLERQGASSATVERFANRLGVNTTGTTPLQQALAYKLAFQAVDPTREHPEDLSIGAQNSVYRLNSVVNQKLSSSAKSIEINNVIYAADTENTLAREAIMNITITDALAKVPREKVLEILKAKLDKTPMPPKVSTDEKAIWKLSAEVLSDYLSGVLKSSDDYKNLLQILPLAN